MNVAQTKQFKKDVKRMRKRGKDLEKVKAVIDLLVAQEPLPPTLVRGLHGGHRAVLLGRDLDELLRTAAHFSADVEVVADQQQERLLPDELRRAQHGVAIAKRLLLLDELKAFGVLASRGTVGLFITGANHDRQLLDARREDFFDDDGQRRLGLAITVHEGLKRERALALAGGGDDGAFDFHKNTGDRSRSLSSHRALPEDGRNPALLPNTKTPDKPKPGQVCGLSHPRSLGPLCDQPPVFVRSISWAGGQEIAFRPSGAFPRNGQRKAEIAMVEVGQKG
jgi:Uncharacterized protein conserved in bacteria